MTVVVAVDVDGPILDGKLRHYSCYSDILRKYGYVPTDIDTYWCAKRQGLSVREQLGLSGAADLGETFKVEWLEMIETPQRLALDQPWDGAVEKIGLWQREDVEVLFATHRRYRERVHRQLVGLGLAVGGNLATADPRGGAADKAEAVREKVRLLDVSQGVWIGDTEVDVEAARLIGWRVWVVTCGLRDASYLEALQPDAMSDRLTDIHLPAAG